MNRELAHRILNRWRDGAAYDPDLITLALRYTGDLEKEQ